ncbi:Ig-like domain-containing protein, partial [Maribacter litoralis]|uniref:Ig-like domain-containing protein n=2 Tax=Maribacter litoralis TaxID=2059726 RepID=UPI003F5CDADE
TATITVTTVDGGFTADALIEVVDGEEPVTGVTVSPLSGTVSLGETLQLAADVQPSDAGDSALLWESSDEAVATVDSEGLVTGIGTGTATITVTTVDGGFTADALIEVVDGEEPVTGVTVSPLSGTVS